jgi:hypothetical protein
MLATAAEPKTHTPYPLRGSKALCSRLREYAQNRDTLFHQFSNLRRRYLPLMRSLSYLERIIDAIRRNDVGRAQDTINASRRRGWGYKRIATLLEDAVRANRTHFSDDRKELAIYLYQVGGPAAVSAMAACNILPSASHTSRLARHGTIPVTDVPSVESVAKAWASQNLSPAPISLHRDEIFLAPRVIVGHDGYIEGLCQHAPRFRYSEHSDLVPLLDGLAAGDFHVASYAQVTALSRHSQFNHEAVAICATPSCNRFTAAEERQHFDQCVRLWTVPRQEQFGPITHLTSDADSRRDKAMTGRCGPIQEVPDMPLYARKVTREGYTISFDQRHITKRMVRRFVNHGLHVDGFHIDVQLLRQMSIFSRAGASLRGKHVWLLWQ